MTSRVCLGLPAVQVHPAQERIAPGPHAVRDELFAAAGENWSPSAICSKPTRASLAVTQFVDNHLFSRRRAHGHLTGNDPETPPEIQP
jgi:hypothetical protein